MIRHKEIVQVKLVTLILSLISNGIYEKLQKSHNVFLCWTPKNMPFDVTVSGLYLTYTGIRTRRWGRGILTDCLELYTLPTNK